MKHWSKIAVGDTVAVKGVRSHLDGRRRFSGTVTRIDSFGQADVDGGARTVGSVRLSSLVHISSPEEAPR